MQGFCRGVLALFIALFLSMPVYSQTSSEQEQPSTIDAESSDPANADAEESTEDNGDAFDEEEVGILIRDIVFSGNKVISTQALREITAPYRGQAMTLQEMGELTDLITMTYQEKGYILARAYLPEQEIAKGVLEVSIAEGNVGKIVVVGQKHFSAGVIKKYFSEQQRHGVIREDLLEKGILFSNEVPQVKTDLVLKEGEKAGDVDVVINAKEVSSVTFGIDASLDYNNYGSEKVGTDRYGVTVDMVDHKLGTKFRFKGVTGNHYDRSRLFSTQLTVPFFDFGSEITASYFRGTTFLENEVQQATVSYLIPTDSVVENVGIQYLQPIIKKRNMSLDVIAGYQKKAFKLFYDNDAVQSNRIDDREVLFGRLSFENLDRYLGRNFANFEYHRGTLEPEFYRTGGGKDDLHTRADADSQFWKAFIQAGRIQKVYGTTNLMVRGSAQYTEDRLVQTEQTAIGGYWTVRGHPVSSVLGDSGYTVTTEVISAPPFISDKVLFGQRVGQLFQIMGFFDHGGVYNNDWETQAAEPYAEYLSGAGGGVRLYYKDLFTFKYTLAFPIDEPGNDDDHVHYFEGTYKFF